MNCKPGDLARIVHPAMYGKLVEILHEQPVGDYYLPDGHPATGTVAGGWVFEFMGAGVVVPIVNALGHKQERLAKFGACNDRWLRPLRDPGDDAKDEMLRPLPEEVEA